jgi:hypothetical protein
VEQAIQVGIIHEQAFGRRRYSIALCSGHAWGKQPLASTAYIKQCTGMGSIGANANIVLGKRNGKVYKQQNKKRQLFHGSLFFTIIKILFMSAFIKFMSLRCTFYTAKCKKSSF